MVARPNRRARGASSRESRGRRVDGKLTIDAIVMATAALTDAIVVTGDPEDFEALSSHFPGVVVLSA
jgi:hypothetical protein